MAAWPRKIRILVARNIQLGWMRCHYYLSSRSPIVIYSIGKTGTSTIRASLKAAKLKRPLFHVHHLTEASIKEALRFQEHRPNKPSATLRQSIFLAKQLASKPDHVQKRWDVISLVRDPVACAISAYFQSIDRWFPSLSANFREGRIDIPVLIQTFLDEYSHDWPLSWFDKQINQSLGVNVYQSEFDWDKGYCIYRGDFANILVLRLENINSCAKTALDAFLNTANIELVNANVSESKDYAQIYQRFKTEICLPESYLERMYSSRLAQHFYSPAEIAGFRAHWTR